VSPPKEQIDRVPAFEAETASNYRCAEKRGGDDRRKASSGSRHGRHDLFDYQRNESRETSAACAGVDAERNEW